MFIKLSKIFCDFGAEFSIYDVTGQNSKCSMVSFITNDNEGIVTTLEEQRHDLEDGAYVVFHEVKGMTEIDQKEYKIKLIGPYSFSIGDTSKFGKYESGGIICEVKKPKTVDFVSLLLFIDLKSSGGT